MISRSNARHTLFRAKNGVPKTDQESVELYASVEKLIPQNESFASFSVGWDILVSATGELSVIVPETDYDFIFATCVKKSIAEEMNVAPVLSPREQNVIQIVEASMLERLMTWTTFNKTWGVSVDYTLKRINTRLFGTKTNKVSDEMIAASVVGDGTKLTETPSIPVVALGNWTQVSPEEQLLIDAALKRK